ncbi:flagellar basal body rod protein FlgC [Pelotomaculum terephthalicicum JT]|uniref:flagellar basal body rod protein FlgC n=1 Tax=Pelotomaculum TaxID=191373 RepID=UPI0009D5E7A2|nr:MULTISPECIES: flagellar basal body rod protein FlgC [Pelotomaculum]MCG9967984.1 flagellar basal body rod protein FlgC [Pelotomaculum terephthalicicum JT]OPX88584.1 MAG: Flagellar basal-body rod protein FlgC [Pelotomaculum sp. PtaB.Bin117]OPY63043.1 MAG: Flagellar basal-body rod protein FlgC [Pelotomaculum sp. PtaU1.Bin065]
MAGFFSSFAISASGLTAERLRLDLIANNIANMNTTGTPDDPSNPPYRRRIPLFAQILKQEEETGASQPFFKGAGVRVTKVLEDNNPPRLVYEPTHPDADERGYVAYPNINVVNEMVNMITATRAYEANVTALNAAKDMALKALEIGRG